MRLEPDVEVIERMKSVLHGQISEWLGFDIPVEGEEDYARWQDMVAEVDAIEGVEDVILYFESRGRDPQEFLRDWN